VGSRTRLVTLVIGSVILGALVGIGHVLWSRSAESEIVHYSWPVKWALTFAAESPDLPAGSRFATAQVTAAQEDRWTVAGDVELPSNEGRRLLTTYKAEVLSRCSSFSERRCWEMAGLSLGSVPAATRAAPTDRGERDPGLQVAALPTASDAHPAAQGAAPADGAADAASAEEDLDFVLGEPLIEPTDALIEAMGGWSTIQSPNSAAPRHDPVLVRDIQRGLAALGYDVGPADGVAGRKTQAAVAAFGRREGLGRPAIDFNLLDRIAQRLDTAEGVVERSSAAPAGALPGDPQSNGWLCRATNNKDRDCDE
jgi:hypothetical protein